MRELSMVVVTIINLLITLRYCWLIWKGEIKPALAMWVFFTIAVFGSLGTYLAEADFSPLDNILNTTDIMLVVSVSIFIVLFGDKSTRFTRFDKGCLIAVLAIIGFWRITENHIASHISIQTILIIAYFPVVKRMWHSNQNTESFAAWIGMFTVSVVSLLSSKGQLATIYALRSAICTGLLLLLMIRTELKQRKTARTTLLGKHA